MKKIFAWILAALTVASASLLTSCNTTAEGGETVSLKNATEIVLSGDTATCDNASVYIGENGKITITAAGTYNVTGTLNNGMIYVECVDAGQIDLVLNGVSITNDDGPCIVISMTVLSILSPTAPSISSKTPKMMNPMQLSSPRKTSPSTARASS